MRLADWERRVKETEEIETNGERDRSRYRERERDWMEVGGNVKSEKLGLVKREKGK